jgi:hypothetical protein
MKERYDHRVNGALLSKKLKEIVVKKKFGRGPGKWSLLGNTARPKNNHAAAETERKDIKDCRRCAPA